MDNIKTFTAEEIYKKAHKSIALIRHNNGHGSGVVVSSDGLILTNYHCYSDQNLTVTIGNKTYKPVNVVNAYINFDLILLKIRANNLKPLTLARTSDFKIGSTVYAIGTPFDLTYRNTLSNGIISGIRQIKEKYFIQTNAHIYQGNSGGALINSSCELIGITSLSVYDKSGLTLAVHSFLIGILLNDKESKINKLLLPYNKLIYNGIQQAKRKDYKGALKNFNKYLKHFPDDSYAYLQRGDLYEKAGYISDAIPDYKKCIRHDSRNTPLHSDKAYAALYKHTKSKSNRLKYLNRAIALDTSNASYLLDRGREYMNDNNFPEAEEHFKICIAMDPTSSMAYYNYAELYFRKGKIDTAIDFLFKAAEYANADKTDYYLEIVSIILKENYKINKEKYIGIIDILYGAHDINHSLPDLNFLLSKCYVELFNYQKAYEFILMTSYYDKRKIIVNWAEYQYYYGVILKNLKNDNSYLPYFEKALEIIDGELPLENPTKEDLKSRNDSLELKAEIHFEMGKYVTALSEFKSVLKKAPNTNPNRLKYLSNKIVKIKEMPCFQ